MDVVTDREKLKPGWTKVKFGEVVRLCKDRSSDPETDGIERYVGLEHLEPEDLRIRSWGLVADGTTFTSRFKPGQVLFGKRRAYQRKVAVADFEGVCSGDIYIFESADSKYLLPELLPFICQTDRFFEYAVGTSAGSLSPRTNWKNLIDYDFFLPPLEEQKKLFLYLNKVRNLLEENRNLLDVSNITMQAGLMSLVIGGVTYDLSKIKSIEDISLPRQWNFVSAKDICKAPVTSGTTPRKGRTDIDTGFPFIRVQNLTFSGELDFYSNQEFLDLEAFQETRTSHVLPGDILTNIVGPPLGKVSVIPDSFPESLINQAIVRFRAEDKDTSNIILGYLISDWAKQWLLSRSTKTSGQRNINSSTCAVLPIPLPPKNQIRELSENISSILALPLQAHARFLSAKHLLTTSLRKLTYV